MVIQRINHYFDSILTQEMARMNLDGGKIVIAWYTNQINKQSVVHSHPYYEFVLPVSGSDVLYSVNGKLYQIHTGEIIYFPSEVFHSGKFNVTEDVSVRLIIQIDADIWENARKRTGLPIQDWEKDIMIFHPDSVRSWDLRSLFERMAQTAYVKKASQNLIYESQLVELLLLIDQISEDFSVGMPSAKSEIIAKAVEYIQTHYMDPDLTVSSIAQLTFVSREHLSRVFKEYTMESLQSYLTNMRMQHCRRAIAAGKPILDAATESGFSNYSSFLKTFRRLYKMTPQEYKKQLIAAKNGTL